MEPIKYQYKSNDKIFSIRLIAICRYDKSLKYRKFISGW